jgi:hypothetical protein
MWNAGPQFQILERATLQSLWGKYDLKAAYKLESSIQAVRFVLT